MIVLLCSDTQNADGWGNVRIGYRVTPGAFCVGMILKIQSVEPEARAYQSVRGAPLALLGDVRYVREDDREGDRESPGHGDHSEVPPGKM